MISFPARRPNCWRFELADPEGPPSEDTERTGHSPDLTAQRSKRPWEEPIEGPVQHEHNRQEDEDRARHLHDPGAGFFEPDEPDPSISEEAYLSATTAEYRDLAEEIARGGNDDPGNMP